MPKKIAIVLFNLGGPDNLAAVKPFLFNLFNDKAIIGAPQPIRYLLAKFISSRREKKAQHIYEQMGGKSPILELTTAQAQALEKMLNQTGAAQYRTFTCMRYWHPRAGAVVQQVKEFAPEEIILLPLYPQYSTTTSGSSVAEWHNKAKAAGLNASTRTLCCFPTEPDFIAAHAAQLAEMLDQASQHKIRRVLFSAHGLPKKIIESGDPYQWQIEKTAEAIINYLDKKPEQWKVTYQSKVGPLEWLTPSTEDEILRAAQDKVAVIIVPIAFISEHSETLVELDIEYKQLAAEHGLTAYYRVPALGTHPDFIRGLSALVLRTTGQSEPVSCQNGGRCCPPSFSRCPCQAAPSAL